ncbi:MAG: iron-sulfur cluster co-chaperone HscB C-terminal domain-containing protein [Phycisphaeraceae bacterium]
METNPFGVLGLPERFDLEDEAIESAYLGLAAAAHPDRYSDPLEQADAVERASAINAAREMLLNPESRARALLGIREGTEGGAGGDENALPADFLMEVMEVRERLEEAIASEEPGELAALHRWADEARSEHLATLGRQFEAGEMAGVIRRELNALRYIQRMLDQMPPPHSKA